MLKAIHGCSGFAALKRIAPNPRGCCNPVTSDARLLPESQEIERDRKAGNFVDFNTTVIQPGTYVNQGGCPEANVGSRKPRRG
jgi:hypothetical protein